MKVSRLTYVSALATMGVGIAGGMALFSPRPVLPKAVAALPQQTPAPLPHRKTTLPAGMKANELGRIPILMYHSVGEYRTKYDRHGLNITPATFRKHLKLLHDNNFYPVNMRDLLEPDVEIPAGKTPVVLTFDDARGSQFRYKGKDTIDPDCVIGILEECHRKWGDDWPQRASFYVLPYSKYNPTPFWQPGREKEKIQFLADAGYEIANHSTSHRPLNRLSDRELIWEVTNAQTYFRKLSPKATMDTMAVPYGIFPKTKAGRALLLNEGNKCVLMAWGGASYAPFDRRFDRASLLRIGCEPGEVENWVKVLVKARKQPAEGMRTYISDGDVEKLTLPQSLAKYLAKPQNLRVAVYNDAPPPKTAKAVKKNKPVKVASTTGGTKASQPTAR